MRAILKRSVLAAIVAAIAVVSDAGVSRAEAADHLTQTSTAGAQAETVVYTLYKSVFNTQTMMNEWQVQGTLHQTLPLHESTPYGPQGYFLFKYRKTLTGMPSGVEHCAVFERCVNGGYVFLGEDYFYP